MRFLCFQSSLPERLHSIHIQSALLESISKHLLVSGEVPGSKVIEIMCLGLSLSWVKEALELLCFSVFRCRVFKGTVLGLLGLKGTMIPMPP